MACGSDDDGGNSKGQQSEGGEVTIDRTITKITVAYYYKTTEDLLKLFDMKMEFVDPTTGTAKSENITSTSWTKSYEVKLPFVTGMRLTTTLKDGVTLESIRNTTEYTVLSPWLDYKVLAYNAKGNIVFSSQTGGDVDPVVATGDRVALGYEWKVFNVSFYNTYTADGTFGIIEEKGKWQ